jgi:serine/threonine-protein kinase
VKVLDFGISKTSEAQSRDQSLTATAAIMGSPMYMSPEQLRSSKNVDVRTDIWALGTILYELIAGHPPFDDETVTGLCSKIAADPAPLLRQWVPDVAPGFEAVVMRCLEKDAALRPQTVGELATALRPFASAEMKLGVDRIVRIGGPARPAASGPLALGVPGAASDPRVASGRTHSATGLADTVATWNTSGTAKRRRTTTIVAAVVGLAAGAGVVVFVLAGKGTTPAPAPALAPVSAPAPVLAPAAAPPLVPTSALASASALAPVPDPTPAAPSSSVRPLATVPVRLPGTGAAPPRPTARPPSAAPAPASTKTDDLLLDRK